MTDPTTPLSAARLDTLQELGTDRARKARQVSRLVDGGRMGQG